MMCEANSEKTEATLKQLKLLFSIFSTSAKYCSNKQHKQQRRNARLQSKCCCKGEATKQAWWIIIQMFWTGTLNGMRSRLTSRKILITHLISHCASSAPEGAPACVCVRVYSKWVRAHRGQREDGAANAFKAEHTFQCVGTQEIRKTKAEKSVTH